MRTDFMVATRLDRKRTGIAGGLLALPALAALALVPVAALAAGSGPTGPSSAVKFESIPGTDLKRVILTARAAERLGIVTGKVAEQKIVRKQMVGGQVIHPLRVQQDRRLIGGFGAFMKPAVVKPEAPPLVEPAPGETWVKMTLSEEEWDRVAQDRPARLLPLATRPGLKNEVAAVVSKRPPEADPKRSMLDVYYVVQGKDHGLKVNDRMRIELELKGDNQKKKVVPYSAVYYDGRGKPWVYAVAKPLVYERKPIKVERIVGDVAVLSDGPALGTEIVTVGSSLLFGAEVIYKR